MEGTITLNDGTVLTGHMNENAGQLFIYLREITMAESFELLNDPEKTRIIKADLRGEKSTARGYTHLRAISEEMGGDMICAAMIKN